MKRVDSRLAFRTCSRTMTLWPSTMLVVMTAKCGHEKGWALAQKSHALLSLAGCRRDGRDDSKRSPWFWAAYLMCDPLQRISALQAPENSRRYRVQGRKRFRCSPQCRQHGRPRAQVDGPGGHRRERRNGRSSCAATTATMLIVGAMLGDGGRLRSWPKRRFPPGRVATAADPDVLARKPSSWSG